MANIRVTPEELTNQGTQLQGYAGQVEDILKEVDQKIEEIIGGWDGLAQDAYYDMYSTMKTTLEKFPKLLNDIGGATIKAAEAFSTVDSELQSNFQSVQ